MPQIFLIGQNAQCVFCLVGQFFILVGDCWMSDHYFKACYSFDFFFKTSIFLHTIFATIITKRQIENLRKLSLLECSKCFNFLDNWSVFLIWISLLRMMLKCRMQNSSKKGTRFLNSFELVYMFKICIIVRAVIITIKISFSFSNNG